LNLFICIDTVTSMPRPAATAAQRAEQRQRIRLAAAELYQQEGLPALSVRAIAKRAGVSTGLLYSYFANLSEFLRTLRLGPISELGHNLADIEAAEPDPIARIERLLQTYIDFATDHPDVHRGLLLFVRPPTSPPPDRGDPDHLLLHATLRRAIVEAQAAGEVRAGDPTVLAELLWSGVHGALALPVNVDTYALTDARELATEMVATLMTAITTNPIRQPTGS
jgi:AcrR family transcriptional regulator